MRALVLWALLVGNVVGSAALARGPLPSRAQLGRACCVVRPAPRVGHARCAARALVPPPNAAKFVVGCVLAGSAGAVFVVPSLKTWYADLRKPAWCPPGGLFGPVWTVLYASLGYAAALAAAVDPAKLVIFYAHMAINLTWAPIFFGAKRIALAAYWNIALCAFAVANARAFYRVSPLAGQLLVPYLAWCAFATALNFAIVRLNRGGAVRP
ncbi:hypothetical protein KFE25_010307 [Diacronema lutheri]|uniref:Translocator protein n=2 Tax=Diacronema lutheri TaxID=2081491 RepID=A0A8J5XJG7_DIALT|nr:hypothetical protein KFE25_010307 [Diacronema lutheri]